MNVRMMLYAVLLSTITVETLMILNVLELNVAEAVLAVIGVGLIYLEIFDGLKDARVQKHHRRVVRYR
ncbi:MAG: hypothetical protein Q4B26_16320 [Eubacteriales bacterium]|nr:hypothetical protein [Eubacteriales bacterium]